jgi:hypothetical protein
VGDVGEEVSLVISAGEGEGVDSDVVGGSFEGMLDYKGVQTTIRNDSHKQVFVLVGHHGLHFDQDY